MSSSKIINQLVENFTLYFIRIFFLIKIDETKKKKNKTNIKYKLIVKQFIINFYFDKTCFNTRFYKSVDATFFS